MKASARQKKILPAVFLFLTTALMSLGDPWPMCLRPPFITWVLGLGALVLHLYFTHKYQADLQTSEKKVESLEVAVREREQVQAEHRIRYGAAFREVLAEIGSERRWNANDRVSVYKARENRSGFALLGRYSPNDSYDKPGPRATYPIDRGFIADASNHRGLHHTGLPDPKEKEYVQWQKGHGLKSKEVKALTMKSRCYYSYLVDEGLPPLRLTLSVDGS